MGFTIDGAEGGFRKIPSAEEMWGSKLENVGPSILRVDTVTSPALDLIQVSFTTLDDVKNEALTDLNAITEGIEADIAYFNTLGGLAIAMNKLAMIKSDIKNVMLGLERI